MKVTTQDFAIEIAGQSLVAKRWHSHSGKKGQGLPVLALHGWLDNAASFDFLAPLLPELDLVCVDLPGHGRSSHRQGLTSYTVWREVIDMFAFADALNWREFALLGHSRGAAIASMMAATFPERITHLGLIEGVFPFVNTFDQGPEQLRQCIEYLSRAKASNASAFATYEEAIKARVNGLFKISDADARVLAERALIRTDRGYQWHYDFKLRAPSEVYMQKEQVDAYMSLLDMPTRVVLGDEGYIVNNTDWSQWLDEYPSIKKFQLAGAHHLHMSENAEAVAKVLHDLYR